MLLILAIVLSFGSTQKIIDLPLINLDNIYYGTTLNFNSNLFNMILDTGFIT